MLLGHSATNFFGEISHKWRSLVLNILDDRHDICKPYF